MKKGLPFLLYLLITQTKGEMNQTKNLLIWICSVLCFFNTLTAQVSLNGQLDNIEEFSTIITKDVVMP
ncbi:MAG: hypothetical protein WD334_03555, partial [Chitinophagales bacterium]